MSGASFIQVEIETQDQNSAHSSSGAGKVGTSKRNMGRDIETLENQVDKEIMENHKRKQKNDEIREKLSTFGEFY